MPPTTGGAWCTRKQVEANNVQFVGCFWDNSARDLKNFVEGPPYDIATCSQWAVSRNYKYFALQANGECRVANQYGGKDPYGLESNGGPKCGNMCEGETMKVSGGSFCGGSWINAIYLALPEPTPEPTPAPAPLPTQPTLQTQAPLLKSSKSNAAPTPAPCQNTTVLQKLNGKVEFGEIQLCGGEKPKCYIRNTCEEPTTTIITTTITITTSTTTTLLYECHCKAFAQDQLPGCQGQCCAGGQEYDSDCMLMKTENSCNGRTNGASQQFCVWKSHSHWETMKMSR